MASLPYIRVPANKSYRATANGLYGAPLKRVYPPGVFYASNMSGAPGQPASQRMFPSGNQATDPRAQNSAYANINPGNDTSALTPSNVGGSVFNLAPQADGSHWILYGALALIAWAIFKG